MSVWQQNRFDRKQAGSAATNNVSIERKLPATFASIFYYFTFHSAHKYVDVSFGFPSFLFAQIHTVNDHVVQIVYVPALKLEFTQPETDFDFIHHIYVH